jgi:hypothetical protein
VVLSFDLAIAPTIGRGQIPVSGLFEKACAFGRHTDDYPPKPLRGQKSGSA